MNREDELEKAVTKAFDVLEKSLLNSDSTDKVCTYDNIVIHRRLELLEEQIKQGRICIKDLEIKIAEMEGGV